MSHSDARVLAAMNVLVTRHIIVPYADMADAIIAADHVAVAMQAMYTGSMARKLPPLDKPVTLAPAPPNAPGYDEDLPQEPTRDV